MLHQKCSLKGYFVLTLQRLYFNMIKLYGNSNNVICVTVFNFHYIFMIHVLVNDILDTKLLLLIFISSACPIDLPTVEEH